MISAAMYLINCWNGCLYVRCLCVCMCVPMQQRACPFVLRKLYIASYTDQNMHIRVYVYVHVLICILIQVALSLSWCSNLVLHVSDLASSLDVYPCDQAVVLKCLLEDHGVSWTYRACLHSGPSFKYSRRRVAPTVTQKHLRRSPTLLYNNTTQPRLNDHVPGWSLKTGDERWMWLSTCISQSILWQMSSYSRHFDHQQNYKFLSHNILHDWLMPLKLESELEWVFFSKSVAFEA